MKKVADILARKGKKAVVRVGLMPITVDLENLVLVSEKNVEQS